MEHRGGGREGDREGVGEVGGSLRLGEDGGRGRGEGEDEDRMVRRVKSSTYTSSSDEAGSSSVPTSINNLKLNYQHQPLYTNYF
jgi:hypothetical protein